MAHGVFEVSGEVIILQERADHTFPIVCISDEVAEAIQGLCEGIAVVGDELSHRVEGARDDVSLIWVVHWERSGAWGPRVNGEDAATEEGGVLDLKGAALAELHGLGEGGDDVDAAVDRCRGVVLDLRDAAPADSRDLDRVTRPEASGLVEGHIDLRLLTEEAELLQEQGVVPEHAQRCDDKDA